MGSGRGMCYATMSGSSMHPSAEQRYRAKGIKLWHNPPRSPDLNPVELFWSWLRRDLRRRDLEDLHRRREPPNKAAYRARARAVLRSKKAKVVAASITKSFRKTCQRVVDLGGAHSGN